MLTGKLNRFDATKTGRWLRIKTPLLVSLLLLFGFLSAPSIVGYVLTKEAPPRSKWCTPSTDDLQLVNGLQSAWELEREGRVESASTEYRAALQSRDNCVRSIALRELARISDFREHLGPAYRVIADATEFSLHLQGPIVAALLTLIIYWCAANSFPLRGTRISEFPVYGCSDKDAGAQFRNSLLSFSNEIRDVYTSNYAHSIGMTLLFEDFKGQTIEGSGYDDAFEGAKDPDTKAAVRFALKQAIRFVRDWERPRVLIEGNVRLLPGGAKGAAIITDRKLNRNTRIEAHTDELIHIIGGTFVQRELLNPIISGSGPILSRQAEDLRKTSSELHALALILACKIRFEELRLLRAGYKPKSWKTVYLFAGAARSWE